MATYVVLMNWTDQGVKTAKDTVNRYQQATTLFEQMGSKIETVYWTSGGYDLVAVVTAPDDETLAALLLSLAGGGNLRTHTLRAFTEADMTNILGKMP
jgi:uncharacterized protein with GYD domain